MHVPLSLGCGEHPCKHLKWCKSKFGRYGGPILVQVVFVASYHAEHPIKLRLCGSCCMLQYFSLSWQVERDPSKLCIWLMMWSSILPSTKLWWEEGGKEGCRSRDFQTIHTFGSKRDEALLSKQYTFTYLHKHKRHHSLPTYTSEPNCISFAFLFDSVHGQTVSWNVSQKPITQSLSHWLCGMSRVGKDDMRLPMPLKFVHHEDLSCSVSLLLARYRPGIYLGQEILGCPGFCEPASDLLREGALARCNTLTPCLSIICVIFSTVERIAVLLPRLTDLGQSQNSSMKVKSITVLHLYSTPQHYARASSSKC